MRNLNPTPRHLTDPETVRRGRLAVAKGHPYSRVAQELGVTRSCLVDWSLWQARTDVTPSPEELALARWRLERERDDREHVRVDLYLPQTTTGLAYLERVRAVLVTLEPTCYGGQWPECGISKPQDGA